MKEQTILNMEAYTRKEDDYTSIIDKLESFRAKIIDVFHGIEVDISVFVICQQIHIQIPNGVRNIEKKLNSLNLNVLHHGESVFPNCQSYLVGF